MVTAITVGEMPAKEHPSTASGGSNELVQGCGFVLLVRRGLTTPSVRGCSGCFFDLRRLELIDGPMPIANQQCVCEPCGCSVSQEQAVEKEGKIYCSQTCADGRDGGDQCCVICC